MKTVRYFTTTSWSIYDSWSELLAGTRLLLDILEKQKYNKIVYINLLRLTLVSSSQMTEVMLFTQLKKCVNFHSEATKKLFKYDLKKRISFNEARNKWPEILTGKNLDFSSEPMQSMKSLSNYRNAAIHHTAKCPMIDIGESAFYTAIESSKYLYNHFNEGRWDSSEYKKFVNDNQAKIKTLLRKALDE